MPTPDTGPPAPLGSSRLRSRSERLSRNSGLCRDERRDQEYPIPRVEASHGTKEARS